MEYKIMIGYSVNTIEAETPKEAIESYCEDKVQVVQICYHQDINTITGIVDLDNGTLRAFKVEAK